MADDTSTDEAARARALRELVAALDRRVPQMHRVGEASIARAAAALRTLAMKRIEEFEQSGRTGE